MATASRMRVLVTGASGFIGRQTLQPLLERGFEVHAVSRTPQSGRSDVTWHTADLLQEREVESLIRDVAPTHLLHFAWYAEPGKYAESLENFRWVRASLFLLEQFARTSGIRVVMAGSCFEYDWSQGKCCEATTPLLPNSTYGLCKHALQMLAQAYCQKSELSFAWGRIFWLYGPHEHPQRLVPSATTAILKGERTKLTSGEQLRDFTYVKDAASMFVDLLESNVEGTVNIGSGRATSIKDLISEIGKKLGREDLIRFGEIASRPGEPPLVFADTARLRDEVRWQETEGRDSLDETISWWEDQLGMPHRIKREASRS